MNRSKFWERCTGLVRVVRAAHEEVGLVAHGHSFDHPLRVGQLAFELTEVDRNPILAGAAGLCHNADRVLERRLRCGRSNVPKEQVEALVGQWLKEGWHYPLPDEYDLIIDAVVRHNGPNVSIHDNRVLFFLQEADRVVNVMPDAIMRAAQFQPDLPDVDPIYLLNDPGASYFKPGSVLWNLYYMATRWDPTHPLCDARYCLRHPEAIRMALPHFVFLREYCDRVLASRRESGFVPYPTDFAKELHPVVDPEVHM